MQLVHAQNTRIATLQGAIITFEANVPRDVPENLIQLSLAHGARVVNPADIVAAPVTPIDITVEQTLVPPQPPKELDEVKLQRIIREIVERGQKDEFRSDGQPKSSVLNRMFGRVVTEVERTAAWEAVMKKV